MKKSVWILLFMALFSIGQAQSTLGIDTSFLSYAYTSPTSFNNADLYKVSVYNYGPQMFVGNYEVVYAVDSANTGALLIAYADSVTNTTIPVNGSVPDSAIISISTLYYRAGINTVVIWPRMTSTPFTTLDSIRFQVLVTGFAGIAPTEIKFDTKIYPNPAHQTLLVLNNDPNFAIERVRIFNALGTQLSDAAFTGKVDLGDLATGSYYLEFVAANGQTRRHKLIKE